MWIARPAKALRTKLFQCGECCDAQVRGPSTRFNDADRRLGTLELVVASDGTCHQMLAPAVLDQRRADSGGGMDEGAKTSPEGLRNAPLEIAVPFGAVGKTRQWAYSLSNRFVSFARVS